MRKIVAWILVTFGIAALVRRLRRRSAAVPEAGERELDDPAAELRRKLDESRAAQEPDAEEQPRTVEERRADVHSQARSALDEMQAPDES